MAPDAKVAFFDIGASSGVLYGPAVGEIYPPMRKAGALVCTNSWGGTFRGDGYVLFFFLSFDISLPSFY